MRDWIYIKNTNLRNNIRQQRLTTQKCHMISSARPFICKFVILLLLILLLLSFLRAFHCCFHHWKVRLYLLLLEPLAIHLCWCSAGGLLRSRYWDNWVWCYHSLTKPRLCCICLSFLPLEVFPFVYCFWLWMVPAFVYQFAFTFGITFYPLCAWKDSCSKSVDPSFLRGDALFQAFVQVQIEKFVVNINAYLMYHAVESTNDTVHLDCSWQIRLVSWIVSVFVSLFKYQFEQVTHVANWLLTSYTMNLQNIKNGIIFCTFGLTHTHTRTHTHTHTRTHANTQTHTHTNSFLLNFEKNKLNLKHMFDTFHMLLLMFWKDNRWFDESDNQTSYCIRIVFFCIWPPIIICTNQP